MPPGSLFREDRISVCGHLEDAARGPDQGHLGIGNLPVNFRRQTGGAGFVVSDYTELDLHMHCHLRWVRESK
jgi:hypothetical protein